MAVRMPKSQPDRWRNALFAALGLGSMGLEWIQILCMALVATLVSQGGNSKHE